MMSASTHSVNYWICIPRSGNGEGYTSKCLKQKLKEHYGDNVTITTSSGRPIIYSFCDIEHDILRDNLKSARDPKSPTDKDSIISAAASIIRNDIRTSPYDCSEYPRMDDLSDCASLVPESLLFLYAIIKSNNDASNSDRRWVAIAHYIISACRPPIGLDSLTTTKKCSGWTVYLLSVASLSTIYKASLNLYLIMPISL